MTMISQAKHRILLAGLYIGEGPKQETLMRALRTKSQSVPVYLLLDMNRSTRKGSLNLYRGESAADTPLAANYIVNLYKSPLHGAFASVLPERVNEVVSVQHMKAVVVDDTVLITGANYSTSYFTDRQDRYMIFKSKQLADGVEQLIKNPESPARKIPRINLQSDKTTVHLVTQAGFLDRPNVMIRLQRWLASHSNRIISSSSDSTNDIPSVRGIDKVFSELLNQAKAHDYKVTIASGYLNLTPMVMDILSRLKHVTLITAAPSANSFYQSKGFSRFVPAMYSTFEEQILKNHPTWQLHEYNRPEWTFHAKGLWLYPPSTLSSSATSPDSHSHHVIEHTSGCEELPIGTMIGSSNFSRRSSERDLEFCLFVQTRDMNLRKKLNLEISKIKEFTFEPTEFQISMRSPKWLKIATAALFKYWL